MFNPEFPNIVYIELGTTTTGDERAAALELMETDTEQSFTQIPSYLAEHVAIGSAINSAYDGIRAILCDVISYNE